ncbi:CUB and sushi domain-containing protein 2-like protein [Perkinsela sp. CCAP 1560/4]|nr:CUB and sushi domain-containing protein 2-like protein [Perkinsela sp. CCAP 1560/4]|eukprot:KNH09686.1 CUB and sushi domain-containing protein 2-like protein [Perkinsela sp. CCAP 1560/4]
MLNGRSQACKPRSAIRVLPRSLVFSSGPVSLLRQSHTTNLDVQPKFARSSLCDGKEYCFTAPLSFLGKQLMSRGILLSQKQPKAGDNSSGKADQQKQRKEDNDEEEDGDDIYRLVRNLILRFAIVSALFYYFSLPKGAAVSLAEVLKNEHRGHPLEFYRCRVYNTYVQWYSKDSFFSWYYTAIPDVNYFDMVMLPEIQRQHNREIFTTYIFKSWSEWAVTALSIAVWVVPVFYIPLLINSYTRPIYSAAMSSGMAKGSKSMGMKNSINFKPTKSKLKFCDVVGMYEAKNEITEFVEFLSNPTKFCQLGAQIPNGSLLLGPPGVGKTLLAKAMAGEAKANFIACCGSDFVELYAGMGALRIRKLFEQAKKYAPCIIYIDEIDAIGSKRTGDARGGGQEREHTLNQLLASLDGFSKNSNVITIASTNASVSSLDPALVRPGRLDRIVHIERPLIKERIELFEFYLSKINLVPHLQYVDPLDPSRQEREEGRKTEIITNDSSTTNALALTEPQESLHSRQPNTSQPSEFNSSAKHEPFVMENNLKVVRKYAHRLAQLCPGFTGADIRNVCNEGAILSARHRMTFVDIICLEKAADRVLAGIEKRSQVLSAFEKRVVAFHEAGHVIVGWFLERSHPLMKVSIVPRCGKALGYAQYLPSENNIQTEKEMFHDICVCLGGRVAEIVFFNHLSTGAQDDLSKVRKNAYSFVSLYGRVPGLEAMSHTPPGEGSSIYSKPYSDDIAIKIDEECKTVVDRAFEMAKKIVLKNKSNTEKLAEHLLSEEMLTRENVVNIIGSSPYRHGIAAEVILSPTPISGAHPLSKTKQNSAK